MSFFTDDFLDSESLDFRENLTERPCECEQAIKNRIKLHDCDRSLRMTRQPNTKFAGFTVTCDNCDSSDFTFHIEGNFYHCGGCYPGCEHDTPESQNIVADFLNLAAQSESLDWNNLRIVSHPNRGFLESLDEDGTIMSNPLRLDEACQFKFDKHVSAIIESERNSRESLRQNLQQDDLAKAYVRRADERYREKPQNRIRYVKK